MITITLTGDVEEVGLNLWQLYHLFHDAGLAPDIPNGEAETPTAHANGNGCEPAETDEAEVTSEDIFEAMRELVEKVGYEKAQGVVSEFGVAKFSELAPDKLKDVMAAIRKAGVQ